MSIKFERDLSFIGFNRLHRGLAGSHEVSWGIHREEAAKTKEDSAGTASLRSNDDGFESVTVGEVALTLHDGDGGHIVSRPWLSIFTFGARRGLIQDEGFRRMRLAIRRGAKTRSISGTRKEADRAARLFGKAMVRKLKQGLRDDLFPLQRNAPSTIARKGFDHPLVDGGQLMRSHKSKSRRTS